MQRPVMDTMYMESNDADIRSRVSLLKRLAPAWALARRLSRLFAVRLAGVKRGQGLVDNAPLWPALLRGVAYCVACLPPIIGLVVAALVFRETHPTAPVVPAGQSSTPNIFYETASFTSGDGTPLSGWLVPAIDASLVVQERDKVLKNKFPAVVLIHDFGQTQAELLRLIAPLHDEGYVVLAMGLRGQGTATPVGQTFGVKEADDVLAAITFLRDRPYVDGGKMALVGTGSGASAALLASQADGGVSRLVLVNPPERGWDAFATNVVPNHRALSWMRPLCQWGFHIAYGVTPDAVDLKRFEQTLLSAHTVQIEHAGPVSAWDQQSVRRVTRFLADPAKAQDGLARRPD